MHASCDCECMQGAVCMSEWGHGVCWRFPRQTAGGLARFFECQFSRVSAGVYQKKSGWYGLEFSQPAGGALADRETGGFDRVGGSMTCNYSDK
jgi:hypothetical protein